MLLGETPLSYRSHFSSPILGTPFILARMEPALPATWDKGITWPLAWVSQSISSITPHAGETLLFIPKPQCFPRSSLTPCEVGGECSCLMLWLGTGSRNFLSLGWGAQGFWGLHSLHLLLQTPGGLSPAWPLQPLGHLPQGFLSPRDRGVRRAEWLKHLETQQ